MIGAFDLVGDFRPRSFHSPFNDLFIQRFIRVPDVGKACELKLSRACSSLFLNAWTNFRDDDGAGADAGADTVASALHRLSCSAKFGTTESVYVNTYC